MAKDPRTSQPSPAPALAPAPAPAPASPAPAKVQPDRGQLEKYHTDKLANDLSLYSVPSGSPFLYAHAAAVDMLFRKVAELTARVEILEKLVDDLTPVGSAET